MAGVLSHVALLYTHPQADCLPDPGDVFSFLKEHDIGQEHALYYVVSPAVLCMDAAGPCGQSCCRLAVLSAAACFMWWAVLPVLRSGCCCTTW
jgi:hypothetical protein